MKENRGHYKRDEQHRVLMSQIKKGIKLTEETKEKLRKVNLGKRYSDEVNKKKSLPGIRNGMYGKKRPDLAERNRNKDMSGSNNPQWLGGKSFEPYGFEFNRRLKKLIRDRDNSKCMICNQKGNNIHHVDYNKRNNNPNNLITLCAHCHGQTHHNRDYWIAYFKINIMEDYGK